MDVLKVKRLLLLSTLVAIVLNCFYTHLDMWGGFAGTPVVTLSLDKESGQLHAAATLPLGTNCIRGRAGRKLSREVCIKDKYVATWRIEPGTLRCTLRCLCFLDNDIYCYYYTYYHVYGEFYNYIPETNHVSSL
jgi:hypothetical protein